MTVGLLPQGFYDALYPSAQARMQSIYEILNHVLKAGYELVDPPLVEFEDTLFEGAGSVLIDETFRVMDPKSHRMMGIRADMTVQVARIAASRLKTEKRPLRLAYAGQVLKVKGDMLYGQRQLWQTGIELVGESSLTAENEILNLAITALQRQGVKDICVDFTMPTLAPKLLHILSIEPSVRQDVLHALDKKDASSIKRLVGDKNAALLLPLLQLEDSLAPLKAINFLPEIKELCVELEKLIEMLKKKHKKISYSIDLFESLKFPYHTGIAFSIFAKGAKAELARGGRYEINMQETKEPAVGVTFYLNELLRLTTG